MSRKMKAFVMKRIGEVGFMDKPRLEQSRDPTMR
jgi:hypothetical protein